MLFHCYLQAHHSGKAWTSTCRDQQVTDNHVSGARPKGCCKFAGIKSHFPAVPVSIKAPSFRRFHHQRLIVLLLIRSATHVEGIAYQYLGSVSQEGLVFVLFEHLQSAVWLLETRFPRFGMRAEDIPLANPLQVVRLPPSQTSDSHESSYLPVVHRQWAMSPPKNSTEAQVIEGCRQF